MTKQPEAPRESILAHNNMGLSKRERVKLKVLKESKVKVFI